MDKSQSVKALSSNGLKKTSGYLFQSTFSLKVICAKVLLSDKFALKSSQDLRKVKILWTVTQKYLQIK